MFIILEGIDCSGKSWAAEQLCKSLSNSIYIKQWNTPKKGTNEEIVLLRNTYGKILNFYKSEIEPSQGNLVVDRYYPSEIVYSGVKRNYETSYFKQHSGWYKDLEEEIRRLDHILLYVHAPMKEVLKRLSYRGDTYIEHSDLEKLEERYNKFCSMTDLEVSNILSGSEDLDEFLKEKRL